MYVRNATIRDLEQALKNVNKIYGGNVAFNRYPENYRGGVRFTLKVKDSKGPGHRLGSCKTTRGNRRRLASACWHVHGHFFECLFDVVPDAVLTVAGGQTITSRYGNWEDRNIGSIIDPLYYSEACDCEN